MSQQCHVCGPVRHEAPTVLCASCAISDADMELFDRFLTETIEGLDGGRMIFVDEAMIMGSQSFNAAREILKR